MGNRSKIVGKHLDALPAPRYTNYDLRTKLPSSVSAGSSIESLEQSTLAAAKKQFISASVGMGWRLAIAVLLPIIAGVKLDQHFHTSSAYTIVAFMVATVACVVIVKDAMRTISRQQTPPVRSKSRVKRHVK